MKKLIDRSKVHKIFKVSDARRPKREGVSIKIQLNQPVNVLVSQKFRSAHLSTGYKMPKLNCCLKMSKLAKKYSYFFKHWVTLHIYAKQCTPFYQTKSRSYFFYILSNFEISQTYSRYFCFEKLKVEELKNTSF